MSIYLSLVLLVSTWKILSGTENSKTIILHELISLYRHHKIVHIQYLRQGGVFILRNCVVSVIVAIGDFFSDIPLCKIREKGNLMLSEIQCISTTLGTSI